MDHGDEAPSRGVPRSPLNRVRILVAFIFALGLLLGGGLTSGTVCYLPAGYCSIDPRCELATSNPALNQWEPVDPAYGGYDLSQLKCGTKGCYLLFRCRCGNPTAGGGDCNL